MSHLKHARSGYAYGVSAIQWDFHYSPAKLGHHPDSNTHPDDKKDIYLQKEGTDYRLLSDTSLFTVGGYFHYHELGTGGIYIEDGLRTVKKLGCPHVGIVNFEEVKGITSLHRVNRSKIYDEDAKTPIWERAYVKFHGVDFTNKTIGFSLCGELYWVGLDYGVCDIVSSDTIKLNLNAWGLYEKVYHLKDKFGHIPNMGLTPYTDGRIVLQDLQTREFIETLLTLPQTFLVVLDTPKPIKMWYTDVIGNQLPWRYQCGKHHFAPLRMSDGRYTPYIIQERFNGFNIITQENRVYPLQNDTLVRKDQAYLTELNISSRKGYIQRAAFLNVCFEDNPDIDPLWEGDNRTYEDLRDKFINKPNGEAPDDTLEPEKKPFIQLSNNILICGRGWYHEDDTNTCVDARDILTRDGLNVEKLLKLNPTEQLSFLEGWYRDGFPVSHGPEYHNWDDELGFIPTSGTFRLAPKPTVDETSETEPKPKIEYEEIITPTDVTPRFNPYGD